jgi:hypothetical protein
MTSDLFHANSGAASAAPLRFDADKAGATC